MKAEKVRARGKIAHAMALCFKFVSIAQLFHAVEIVVPTEEFIEIEIHEITDLLGAIVKVSETSTSSEPPTLKMAPISPDER